jgi:hypothetical protein
MRQVVIADRNSASLSVGRPPGRPACFKDARSVAHKPSGPGCPDAAGQEKRLWLPVLQSESGMPRASDTFRPWRQRQGTVGSCRARDTGLGAGVEAGCDTGLGAGVEAGCDIGLGAGAEAGCDIGFGAGAEAGRGEDSEFFERIDCSISCSFVISRVICSWLALSWSTLRAICS